MGVTEILAPDRVSVATEAEGKASTKADAIRRLGALLARGQAAVSPGDIERILAEREQLQSTGVGGGVAIPHGTIDVLDRLIGAVLICPEPIEFDAIDHAPVTILVAVVGPKRARGEHLKMLARISRLLRDDFFRDRLLRVGSGREAYAMIAAEEGRGTQP